MAMEQTAANMQQIFTKLPQNIADGEAGKS